MDNEGNSLYEGAHISYTKSGIKVVRSEDGISILPRKLQDLLHWTKWLYKAIEVEKPNIIMVHNLQFLNLHAVTKYKQRHPEVRLLGDTHATYATTVSFFS